MIWDEIGCSKLNLCVFSFDELIAIDIWRGTLLGPDFAALTDEAKFPLKLPSNFLQ